MKLLITSNHILNSFEEFQSFFAKNNIEVICAKPKRQTFNEAEMLDLIEDVHACICGDDAFTEKVLKKGYESELRFVMRWGIGVDSIDLNAANKIGVKIYNNPDVFGQEVADLALALLLSVYRNVPQIDKAIGSGEWKKIQATSLHAKTVGVIGNGDIGKQIVKRLQAFGCSVKVYSRSASSPFHTPLDELISTCDAILPACPLTDETRHLINAQSFEKMKDGVVIVNIARGGVIDEKALIAALKSRKVFAAGLDVFEKEPVEKDNPLLSMENVILSSHNGSNTKEAVNKVNWLAVEKACYIFQNPNQTQYQPVI